MGSTELIANLFRISQTEEKLKKDKVKSTDDANETHYIVGKEVRNTIERVGGTMPENLPTPFYENDDFIASDYFDNENLEELKFLLDGNDDIPFYMPSKDKFLKFEDDLYYEMTPQLQKLKDFIISNMKNDEQAVSDKQDVNELIDDIELVCALEEPLQDILDEFERHNILFDSPSQLNKIIPLIIDVYDNVRTWPNRGNTHSEMSRITGKPLPKRFQKPLCAPMKNIIKLQKINRNDPCPCGSGKKYKKCCGQNQR